MWTAVGLGSMKLRFATLYNNLKKSLTSELTGMTGGIPCSFGQTRCHWKFSAYTLKGLYRFFHIEDVRTFYGTSTWTAVLELCLRHYVKQNIRNCDPKISSLDDSGIEHHISIHSLILVILLTLLLFFCAFAFW